MIRKINARTSWCARYMGAVTTTTVWSLGERTSAMDGLLTGDIIPVVTLSFTRVMGSWFFLLIYIMFMMLAYLKTQTIIFPALIGLVFGMVGIMYMPPEAHTLAYIMLFLSISVIIYRAVKGSN